MNPKLDEACRMLKMMISSIDIDLYVSVHDKNGVVLYLYPEDGGSDDIRLGEVFDDPTGKLQEVLATGKRVHNHIPSTKFGFALEGNVLPIFDGDELVGCVGVTYIPMNQRFMEAQQIALQSIYGMILSVNACNNKCIDIYKAHSLSLSTLSIVKYSSFREEAAMLIHQDDREKYLALTDLSSLKTRLADKNDVSCECRLRSEDGAFRWTEFIMGRVGLQNEIHSDENYLFMVRDIDVRKSAEEKVNNEKQLLLEELKSKNQALFQKGIQDELTELYNRKGLEHFEKGIFENSLQGDSYLFICVLDIDGLKYINDHFGHESGDQAIRVMSRLLCVDVPMGALCARTGGDEFVVIANCKADENIAHNFMEGLFDRLEDFNKSSSLPYRLHASAGYFFGKPDLKKNIADYVRIADNNMYKMKAGNNTSRSARYTDERPPESLEYNVLLADPEIDSALFPEDYTVFEASTLAEFMNIRSKTEQLDLVILNIDKPQLDGLKILRILKMSNGITRQPFIVTCSMANITDELLDYADEFSALIHRPLNPKLLMARVNYFIRQHTEYRRVERLLGEKNAIVKKQVKKLEEQTALLAGIAML